MSWLAVNHQRRVQKLAALTCTGAACTCAVLRPPEQLQCKAGRGSLGTVMHTCLLAAARMSLGRLQALAKTMRSGLTPRRSTMSSCSHTTPPSQRLQLTYDRCWHEVFASHGKDRALQTGS